MTQTIRLSADEAHHAVHVVRVQAGEAVRLFDGQGREIDGVVQEATRGGVAIAAHQERLTPKPDVRVGLFQAWLLREKSIEFLIQRGAELGVAHFCFFRAARSEKTPRMSSKWQRIAIEACKQCGRAWLPTFAVVPDIGAALEAMAGARLIATAHQAPVPLSHALSSGICTFGDAWSYQNGVPAPTRTDPPLKGGSGDVALPPHSAVECKTTSPLPPFKGGLCEKKSPECRTDALNTGEASVLVGPEGDFTPEEADQAVKAGAVPISLGAVTYRSEVAAALAVTLVLYELGAMGPRN